MKASHISSVEYGGSAEISDLPRFSPSAAAVISEARAEAHRRGHVYICTEHILHALLTSSDQPPPRVIGFIDGLLSDNRETASWRDTMLLLLEGFPTFKPSRASESKAESLSADTKSENDPSADLLFSQSMGEVLEVVSEFASRPVQDGTLIITDGIIATEFLVRSVGCTQS